MPKWGYSITDINQEKTAKASGRELRVSHKHAREVCRTINGMKLDQAKDYLKQVIKKKKPIPFRRFNKKVGHRHGLEKAFSGRYPVKTAAEILKVLEDNGYKIGDIIQLSNLNDIVDFLEILFRESLRKRPFYDAVRAPYLYEGGIMEAIHQFKYGGKSHLANSLGPLLASFAGR